MANDYTKEFEKVDLQKITDKQEVGKVAGGGTPMPEEIEKWNAWYNEAKDLRIERDNRWAKNIKLLRGIFPDDELQRSKVRRRSKIFFRKIWASNQRILAAMHDAFLRETDQFQVVGRNGDDGDEDKAEILQLMVEYRRDLMMRTESLFLQQIWAITSILDLGWACALFGWKYKKDQKIDKPDFTLYPNEQVYPDMRASLPHKMRFIIFEDYMSAEDCKEEGWDITGCEEYSLPANPVRNARFQNQQDPMNYSDTNTNNAYPRPGATGETSKSPIRATYCVRKIFYKEDGELKQAIYCGNKIFVKPIKSPYGQRYPIVMGQCLTLAHQLMGEGFPEPQEGPQESMNVTLNQRKDNIAVLINGESLVDRYANVDLEALKVSRPANIILTDNTEAVKSLQKQDYTQTAYMDASADASMMDETGGVTPGMQGMDRSQKATTSQLNFQNSNAKMGLFISIVAQTWFRDFFTQMAYLIQRFETDEVIFRVANKRLERKRQDEGRPTPTPISDIDDFVADIDIKVQPDMSSKEAESRNILLAMDRAIMSNQALVPLVQSGVIPPGGVELMNPAEFMRILLPKLGQKNVQKFFVKIQKQDLPPPPPTEAANPGGKATQAAAGASAAQAEAPDITASQTLGA